MLILPTALIAGFIVLHVNRLQVLNYSWPYLAAAGVSLVVFAAGRSLPTDMVMSNDHGTLITTRGWLPIGYL